MRPVVVEACVILDYNINMLREVRNRKEEVADEATAGRAFLLSLVIRSIHSNDSD